jgi:ribosomal protein S12 methylthiotransferase accessory factor YcaO
MTRREPASQREWRAPGSGRRTLVSAADHEAVFAALWEAGPRQVYRVDLTRPSVGIPVVKVIAPGLEIRRGFF